MNFQYREKLLYPRTTGREKNVIFCAVLSGDNKDADIIEQQPRLSRVVASISVVQLNALRPSQSRKSNRLAISDRTCRTHILYTRGLHYLCQRRNRPLAFSISLSTTTARPLDIYPHSTRLLHTAQQTMSGLKNSPFGKRLRATQQDVDEEGPRRSRPRTNPVFGGAPASTPSLDTSRPTMSESGGPESPTELHRPNKDYGDRFVPSRDAGDLRTSYNLMEESGPSTPSRNKVIPSESDAAKGKRPVPPSSRIPSRALSLSKRVRLPQLCVIMNSLPSPTFRLYSPAFRYALMPLISLEVILYAGGDGPGVLSSHRVVTNSIFIYDFDCELHRIVERLDIFLAADGFSVFLF